MSHGSSNAHTLGQTHQHVHVPQQSGDRVCPLPACPPCPLGDRPRAEGAMFAACTQTRGVAGAGFPWVGQDGSKSCSQNYPCTAAGVTAHAQGRRNPSGYLGVRAGPGFHPGEDGPSIRNAWKCSALPQLSEPTHPVKPCAPRPYNGDLHKRHLCQSGAAPLLRPCCSPHGNTGPEPRT